MPAARATTVPRGRLMKTGAGDGTAHQPPNHIPTPWMIPTGKNIAAANSSRRRPFAAQKTMEVSQAA